MNLRRETAKCPAGRVYTTLHFFYAILCRFVVATNSVTWRYRCIFYTYSMLNGTISAYLIIYISDLLTSVKK